MEKSNLEGIIQIEVIHPAPHCEYKIIALCRDSSIWEKYRNSNTWHCINNAPKGSLLNKQ